MQPLLPLWTAVKFRFLLGLALYASPVLHAADLTLWYQAPAKNMINEALPIGNGRIGGLIAGGVERERIVLNEDSLWTGDENRSGDYAGMGAYQTLGDLFITLPGQEKFSDYRRDLNIGESLAHVSYVAGGITYRREYFASNPAHVIVVRLIADKPGAYTGSIELRDSRPTTPVVTANRIGFTGALGNGLNYEAQVKILPEGGALKMAGGRIEFTGCNALTLVIGAGTDYAMSFANHYRGALPHARVTADVDAAAARSYLDLRTEHQRDFKQLFERVALDLGESSTEQTDKPIDVRKLAAAKTADPDLETLLFQYGRYLLISCSRTGGLPANLQGLWNDSNNPMWHCDYHTNINIQMNYWAAESANLSECHVPLFDLLLSQIPAWRAATDASPEWKTPAGAMTTRGFAVRTSHNIMGGMGWHWDKTANAWYCQHLWEHYAFGGDKAYLRDTAYPVIKETTQFWEDHLKTLPDGRLVVPNGWSPEHGPVEDGVSYTQQIVWDLFTNCIAASEALGVDKDYREKVRAMRDKLVGPAIGRWGQLKEWMEDRDDPNDHHRHTSQLFAVFPGHQVSVTTTPALAAAARKSLDARGPTGDVREWSFAWRTALYARLHDGEDAHAMLQNLFSARNTCVNLFGLHPPMQIDGNLGITAGMVEMLMQSHEGEINLLPALPAAWADGSVSGLRARGGFEISLVWKGGRLVSATIGSETGGIVRIRYGDLTAQVSIAPGARVKLGPTLRQ
ncbi:MAG TPA: glycoside hydrolase N-terminal domain-containing protein [Rariglobus sp.]|jgi:alpha-L-fucosidase 2|nr:glycoside hydrolase N-terminal domain-containing protein [Rariglobus sp.]